MGNSLLTGLDLLRAREQQKLENRRAEEQQEIENLQAQKEQSLREKEQKRRQDITDLDLKIATQEETTRNLRGKLAAKTEQAFSLTPSIPSSEFEEQFRSLGGLVPGSLDQTGMVQNFGGEPFLTDEEARELRLAAREKFNFDLSQREAEARVSPTVAAARVRAEIDILQESGKNKRATEAAQAVVKGQEARAQGTRDAAAFQARNEARKIQIADDRVRALYDPIYTGEIVFNPNNSTMQDVLVEIKKAGGTIFPKKTVDLLKGWGNSMNILMQMKAASIANPELFPKSELNAKARRLWIQGIVANFGPESAAAAIEYEKFEGFPAIFVQSITGQPGSRVSDKEQKTMQKALGHLGNPLPIQLRLINDLVGIVARNIIIQSSEVREKDPENFNAKMNVLYREYPDLLEKILVKPKKAKAEARQLESRGAQLAKEIPDKLPPGFKYMEIDGVFGVEDSEGNFFPS